MRRIISIMLAVLGSAGHAAEKESELLGTWEYRQAAMPGEFDPEGEILEFRNENGKWSGIYRGLQREGEHGLFYTWVEMDSIKVDSLISFVVPARDFYAKRPQTKSDLTKKEFASSGFSRGSLKFRGRVFGDRLRLVCYSATEECPDRMLEFRKGRWPEKKK